MTAVSQLLGDLAVVSHELVQLPRGPWEVSVMATFDRWYARTERWLVLALDAGLAAHAHPEEVTPALVALLAEPFEETRELEELVAAVVNRFDYIGYEYGYLYGGIPWAQLCVPRLVFAFMRALLASRPELAAELDPEALDGRLVHWAPELFEPLAVPAGMPASHWWWFGQRPG